MRRDLLPVQALPIWAKLNGVDFNGVEVAPLPGSRGSGLIATAQRNDRSPILMTVPKDLVLSLENVWISAKSDKHLKEVLEAVGEYARTARGAILIFLLLQITHSATEGTIGVSNPLTDYVKLLPSSFPLPTIWDDEDRAKLVGTSLEAALEAKLKSLDREFSLLRDASSSISWCQRHWWHDKEGALTFDDWKQVDAMYRSRALDLPGTGHAMVPCIDMANHASGDDTMALYETDEDGKAVLLFREDRTFTAGEELTITYGDSKGACEMMFSYGFIEGNMKTAKELFLDLEIPDDDPLRLAKMAINTAAPGFRLYLQNDAIHWEGPFIWLLCVNEEDGLIFRILQTNDGKRDLKVSWKDQELTDPSELDKMLKKEDLWDVFKLRAIATLLTRLEDQLLALNDSNDIIRKLAIEGKEATIEGSNAWRLRTLEKELMSQACVEFNSKVSDIRFHYLGPQTR